MLQSSRGSVMTPVIADAVAVSGLTRQTMSSLVPGAAWEVSRHGAQADSVSRRGLPHADAAVAARLVNPCMSMDQGL